MTTNPLHDYEANIADNLSRILGEKTNLNANKIAGAMSARGVPMDAKAVSRIVSHERRIKFNEAVCLLNVLGMDNMQELTTPPEIARRNELAVLFREWEALSRESEAAYVAERLALMQITKHVETHHAEAREDLLALVNTWAATWATSSGAGGISSAFAGQALLSRLLPEDDPWAIRFREAILKIGED